MAQYAAFLRGIGPGDPAKSNESLRGAFKKMGFDNVRSFISSGNILFESEISDTRVLEQTIDQGLTKHLGISAPTVVKSSNQLRAFVQIKPFGEYKHAPHSYLTVTFFKAKPSDDPLAVRDDAEDKGYTIVGYDKNLNAVYSMTDQTATNTTDFMVWLERQYGKNITTRTINTIERITKKLGD